MNKFKRWTDEEIEFLRDNYKHMTDEELAEKLGRTVSAIKNRRQKERFVSVEREQHAWTVEEINYLNEYHKVYSSKTLSKKLGLPQKKIQMKLQHLGLRAASHDLINTEIEPFDIYKCTPHNTIYALYVKDEYITDGTAEYLGRFLGIGASTVRWYSYPSAERTDYSVKVVRLGKAKEFM